MLPSVVLSMPNQCVRWVVIVLMKLDCDLCTTCNYGGLIDCNSGANRQEIGRPIPAARLVKIGVHA